MATCRRSWSAPFAMCPTLRWKQRPLGSRTCAALSPRARRWWRANLRLLGPFERLPRGCRIEPGLRLLDVLRRQVVADPLPAELLRDDQSRTASCKRVEHDFAWVTACADNAAQQLLGHLTAVPARALLERTADPTEVPGVLVRLPPLRQVLRPQDPRIVRQPAARHGPRVGIHHLPRRRDPDRVAVERELLGVLDKVEQMRVAAAELLRAVDAECVVPDHPAAAGEADLLLEDQLQLRGVLVADRQP